MKKLFLLSFALLALAACSDDNDNNVVPSAVKLATPQVTFEIVSAREVKIQWSAVENAASYSYAVDQQAPKTVVATQVTIDPAGQSSCQVTVTALSGDAVLFSDSDPASVTINNIPAEKQTLTIDFEGADLGADGYVWGKSKATEQDDTDYSGNPIKSNIFYGAIYTEKDAEVYTYYSDYGHTYDSWSAFVISNHTDMQTAGFANDKSVYAESGADGSAQFAVGYYNAWAADGQGIPVIEFAEAVEMESVAIANSTYVYLYFTNDVESAEKPEFKAVVTGYDNGVKTGDAELTLVAGTTLEEGWKTVDLTPLGKVTRVEFSVVCEDVMAPTYLCVDNLTYVK